VKKRPRNGTEHQDGEHIVHKNARVKTAGEQKGCNKGDPYGQNKADRPGLEGKGGQGASLYSREEDAPRHNIQTVFELLYEQVLSSSTAKR